MSLGLLQNPLAVLFIRRRLHRFPGVAAGFAGIAVHSVPVEIGDQSGGAFFILLCGKLPFQKFLVFHEHVLGQILLCVEAVFNAVQALLAAQVEQIVNADAEDFRQQRQRGDVRHRRRVFPFGHRLRADAQLFRQLLLGQPCFEAKLPDFLSEFHADSLLPLLLLCSYMIKQEWPKFNNAVGKSGCRLVEWPQRIVRLLWRRQRCLRYQARTISSAFFPTMEKPISGWRVGSLVYQSHQKNPANHGSSHKAWKQDA